MKIRLTRRAVEDLSEIATYLNAQNPHAALRVRKSIEEGFEYLTAFPRVGRAQTTGGIRKLVTRKYFYLVYYSLDFASDEIVIVSIRHPARER
jgi:toxin ParE1/3/4